MRLLRRVVRGGWHARFAQVELVAAMVPCSNAANSRWLAFDTCRVISCCERCRASRTWRTRLHTRRAGAPRCSRPHVCIDIAPVSSLVRARSFVRPFRRANASPKRCRARRRGWRTRRSDGGCCRATCASLRAGTSTTATSSCRCGRRLVLAAAAHVRAIGADQRANEWRAMFGFGQHDALWRRAVAQLHLRLRVRSLLISDISFRSSRANARPQGNSFCFSKKN